MTADQHGHECRDAQDASLERLYQYLALIHISEPTRPY